ncbi:ribosome biogenesis GTPase Der [Steroidobacter flavus]|uniref:GTPase Der n=1 Tax=Steroidobacter flavus TaxID=1842136 RepID=A0ABV8SZ97_9GAMM
MLPVVALVGRPNVGKSTLFNFLTRTRDALVADMPGLTRDRNYGYGKVGSIPYVVVDTGGLVIDAQGVEQQMVKQALRAVEEADRVLFLVDARSGETPDDHYIAQTLRKLNKKVFLVANKAEGVDSATAGADFYSLGLGEARAISAQHGDNVRTLMDEALEGIELPEGAAAAGGQDDVRVAVIGRPNVGKSTLINRLLGEERLISFDQPGTTRDAVFVPFERDGQTYTLIDTAGVRRRARVEEAIEKFSVIKALQAVDSANVVIGVIDAHDAVTEQDASLFGMVAERGRALLIAVNKWDGIHSDKRDEIRMGLDLRLPFLDFAPVHFISALHGTGVGELMRAVKHAYDASMREMATPELTRVLETAMEQHQPPLVRGRRIKLRYAHQGGRNPPVIVVHGNQIQHVPDAYKRYLANVFRKNFRLEGTPVRVQFRTDDNPFKGKRNPLTPRQRRTEQRRAKRGHKKS